MAKNRNEIPEKLTWDLATIYKWIDLYSKSNESSVSKADFLELKRQLAKVKEERDILKKVLTIFAEKKK